MRMTTLVTWGIIKDSKIPCKTTPVNQLCPTSSHFQPLPTHPEEFLVLAAVQRVEEWLEVWELADGSEDLGMEVGQLGD